MKDEKLFYSRDLSGNAGKSWSLESNEKFGRFLQANRDIEAGEVIFEEKPLLWGPDAYNPHLVCLACLGYLEVGKECPECGWPICGQECQMLSVHTSAECSYLARHRLNLKKNGSFDLNEINYGCIFLLRIIIKKERDKEFWRTFGVLDSQVEAWRREDWWMDEGQLNINFIRNILNYKSVTPEEILRICGISSTNTFSKYLEPTAKSPIGTKARVSYLLASMMAHSCIPNAEQTISAMKDGMKFTLIATTKIKKGEQILISYTDLAEPTMLRQLNLLKNKLFACTCKRCSDPRELGSDCSTLKCPTCLKKGTKPVGELIAGKSLEKWTCTVCQTSCGFSKVQTLVYRIYQDLMQLLGSPVSTLQEYEKYLSKYGKLLHPGHGLLLKAKFQLCGLYGRSRGHILESMSGAGLARKRELCEGVLGELNILQPGLTSRRGIILYELHAALLLISRQKEEQDRDGGRTMMETSVDYLRSALEILKFEPADTMNHHIYRDGSKTLKKLESYLASHSIC